MISVAPSSRYLVHSVFTVAEKGAFGSPGTEMLATRLQ
jgi:hypothetical protein